MGILKGCESKLTLERVVALHSVSKNSKIIPQNIVQSSYSSPSEISIHFSHAVTLSNLVSQRNHSFPIADRALSFNDFCVKQEIMSARGKLYATDLRHSRAILRSPRGKGDIMGALRRPPRRHEGPNRAIRAPQSLPRQQLQPSFWPTANILFYFAKCFTPAVSPSTVRSPFRGAPIRLQGLLRQILVRLSETPGRQGAERQILRPLFFPFLFPFPETLGLRMVC